MDDNSTFDRYIKLRYELNMLHGIGTEQIEEEIESLWQQMAPDEQRRAKMMPTDD